MILGFNNTLAMEVLSKEFIKVKVDCVLNAAVEKMMSTNISEVFIVNENDEPLGVITYKDIARIKNRGDSMDNLVSEYISGGVVKIDGDISLAECRDLMLERKIGRVPVVENKKLVGVIRQAHIRDYFYMKMEEFNTQLTNVINSLHEGVCGIDSNGYVSLWSKSAEALYNVSAKEIIGKPLKEFFPHAIQLEVLRTKKKIDNLYHEPRMGTHIAISASPIYANGEFIGVVSSDRDITEIKTLSTQLQKANDTLKFLESEVQRFASEDFDNIIGKSPKIIKSIKVARQVARTEASILITGESGTGKEVFARAIHNHSGREGLFVPVNCSAIPDELFESEFFGYEAGAFTGANKKGKLGIFELANNGTVFLDEIADLPMHMQAKLLRVLQGKEIRRVGGERTHSINVRIISATNKNLTDMVSKDKFREDLYYRLNVVGLELPPIRERLGDVDLFIHTFFQEISKKNGKKMPVFEDGVLDILKAYIWKGNVRELKNTVEHMVVLSNNNIVTKNNIPEYILKEVNKTSVKTYGGSDLNKAVEKLEKDMIENALKESNYNKSKTAELLNIKRGTLYYKMSYYGL